MKDLLRFARRLSFLIIILLAISCKKDSYVDEKNELVYPISFTFTNFKSSTNFLKSASLKQQKFAAVNIPANYSEGFLYFWSFNNETLTPDIKYNKSANPSISYNDGKVITYGSGFAFEDYAAGRAINFVGPKQIMIKLPIKDVLSIGRLGFDMTGSSTGPKDFQMYYSMDEGDHYSELQLVNQFGNTSSTGKNSFTYNLDTLKLVGEELWLKIIPTAGERGDAGQYNDATGTLRMDNLHIVGVAPTSSQYFAINKMHYFLFHKDRSDVVFKGELDDINQLNLELDMPLGDYDVMFVLNSSDSELQFPTVITKSSDLYLSNIFSNRNAEIFGHKGTLSVTGNMTSSVVLQRLYSQIKVEFTDNIDLSLIKKIVFKQEHEPFFYSPFLVRKNPVLDQSSIEFIDDFQLNKQIIFNQFLGLLEEAQSINYSVEVHSATEILRTFQLTSALKNNIQLVFRGALLPVQSHNIGFEITKKDSWDNQTQVGF